MNQKKNYYDAIEKNIDNKGFSFFKPIVYLKK